MTDVSTNPAATFLAALAVAEKPIVAAVHGLAIGIGATMLLHCDMVVAAEGTRLQFPFVDLSLVPEAASTLLLPRLIGYQRAAELLMLGFPFDEAAALRMGLVNKTVPIENLGATAQELAEKLVAKPMLTLRRIKALLKADQGVIQSHMKAEFDVFAQCLTEPGTRERLSALVKKGAVRQAPID
ncbi:MAG TPA: enoyl-CoA hydratase-related protein [Magnetospirillum sp.]|jgi:enoyl-CoA hydratase/carnithine racemase|nr:enoyl-CoA hydratase-related protein [Magnetospirillum sp.]